jgi:GT2 family glycosyltransferase
MSPASPEVSVVVVAWRARADVLRCLEALEQDAGLPYEAIVVDDGSGDGTADAVRAAFPAATVLAKPDNEGLVRGRNSALPLIRGRHVLMLDADTVVRPGALPALVAALRSPTVGLAAPKLLNEDGSVQLSCRRYPPLLVPLLRRGPLARLFPNPASHRRHLMMDFDHAQARPVVWAAGAAQMWRADLPQRIGEYDDRLSSYGGEDLDWCLRVWRAGAEVWYVPDAEIVHRWQKLTNQSPFSRKSFRALRDWYYLQWKHRQLRADPRLGKANL